MNKFRKPCKPVLLQNGSGLVFKLGLNTNWAALHLIGKTFNWVTFGPLSYIWQIFVNISQNFCGSGNVSFLRKCKDMNKF